MDFVADLISSCRQGLARFAGQAGGAAGGFVLRGAWRAGLVHCTGMCGPFVLGQVMSDAERRPAAAYGEWRRFAGAALAPYHLGRPATYTALGAAAGTATALPMFTWLSVALLVGGGRPDGAMVAVGWGGMMLRRRLRAVGRWIAPPLLMPNAALMLALARQPPLGQRDSSEHRSARSSRSLVTPPSTHSRTRL